MPPFPKYSYRPRHRDDLGRMEMKKDIGENPQARLRGLSSCLSEDGFIELGLFRILERFDVLGRFFSEDLPLLREPLPTALSGPSYPSSGLSDLWHLDSPPLNYSWVKGCSLGLHLS